MDRQTPGEPLYFACPEAKKAAISSCRGCTYSGSPPGPVQSCQDRVDAIACTAEDPADPQLRSRSIRASETRPGMPKPSPQPGKANRAREWPGPGRKDRRNRGSPIRGAPVYESPTGPLIGSCSSTAAATDVPKESDARAGFPPAGPTPDSRATVSSGGGGIRSDRRVADRARLLQFDDGSTTTERVGGRNDRRRPHCCQHLASRITGHGVAAGRIRSVERRGELARPHRLDHAIFPGHLGRQGVADGEVLLGATERSSNTEEDPHRGSVLQIGRQRARAAGLTTGVDTNSGHQGHVIDAEPRPEP